MINFIYQLNSYIYQEVVFSLKGVTLFFDTPMYFIYIKENIGQRLSLSISIYLTVFRSS